MKKPLALLLVTVAVSVGLTQSSSKDLQSMIDAERAFARMSEELGVRPSFTAFIAEDGILFRPKAVKGKQWMAEHPLPPSDKRPLLKWQPSFADISQAGDMGYTFGPWEFKNDTKDARPAGFGHFVTVWKKQPDGSWKFAVDLGISNPETAWTLQQVEGPPKAKPITKKVVDLEAERNALVALERDFSKSSETQGAQSAFLAHSADYVRVFREGKFPFAGKAKVSEAIPANAGVWTWSPEAWDVARSGDIGYSYGTYWLKPKDLSAKAETGNYFRIWKKQNAVWKVVVDLANPVPEK